MFRFEFSQSSILDLWVESILKKGKHYLLKNFSTGSTKSSKSRSCKAVMTQKKCRIARNDR
eukprot:UN11132